MTIVTLTSDFGLHDYYVPVIKGAALSRSPDLNIIDITHNVKSHDLVQAAYILKNAWSSFPAGTIHVVSVNNYGSEKSRFLAIYHQNHYFLCPDNGIFTLIFDTIPPLVYELPYTGLNFTPIRDLIANAIGHIANDQPFEEIGIPITDMVQRITFQPVIGPAQIKGSIIHIDQYDNAIVNVTRQLFDKVGKGRPFILTIKRHDPITRLSQHYNDAPIGESLCLFNSDNLEIAINMGKAAEMLGIRIDDMVQIDFKD